MSALDVFTPIVDDHRHMGAEVDVIAEMMTALTQHGEEMLLAELREASEKGDTAEVTRVLTGWWRTYVVLSRPDSRARIEAADSWDLDDLEHYSIDDLLPE